MLKRYAINDYWGIDCYEVNGRYAVEVFMRQVPWEEIVDSFYSTDKEEANKAFKLLVAKWRNKC